jgi:hypothetical protein
MRRFQHFLITRFNLALRHWESDKNGVPVRTEEWLWRRFDLFERYCLPSVASQTNKDFSWLVLFDASTPQRFRRKIAGYGELEKFVPVYVDCIKAGFRKSLVDIVLGQLDSDIDRVITTRLDNDDAIHRRAVEVIQDSVSGKEFEVINLQDVYYLEGERLCKWRSECNQFVSIVERVREKGMKTAFFQQNWKIPETHEVKQIPGGPYCLVVVHEQNVFNEQRGTPCGIDELESGFVFSDQPVTFAYD